MKKPNERQEIWVIPLDKEKNELIITRFIFTKNFKEIEEFAVIYVTIIKQKQFEVVRFDCSKTETIHIHQFYLNPPEKRYLNREKNFETIEEFSERIQKNWRKYKKSIFRKISLYNL